MIDQSNRAGRPNGVNVFKNRRRKSSGQSPGASPGEIYHILCEGVSRERCWKKTKWSRWAHVIKTIRPNARNYINKKVNVIKMSVVLPRSVSFHGYCALLQFKLAFWVEYCYFLTDLLERFPSYI